MRRLLITIYLFSFACAPPPERTRFVPRDLTVTKNDASGVYLIGGVPLLWPTAHLPVSFSFAKDTPDWLQTACRKAGESFNTAAGRPLLVFGSVPVDPPGDFGKAYGHNVITIGQNAAIVSDEIGYAHTIYLGTRIVEAHIDFQPSLATDKDSWLTYTNPVSACMHELGHALGFNHREDPQSIMYPMEMMHLRNLSADDRARVVRYYGGDH